MSDPVVARIAFRLAETLQMIGAGEATFQVYTAPGRQTEAEDEETDPPANLGLPAYAQPRAKPSAAQISLKRSELSIATRRPRWALETVTTLWRLMAHVSFIPSFSVRRTSDGTPRIVEVMGATVTADK